MILIPWLKILQGSPILGVKALSFLMSTAALQKVFLCQLSALSTTLSLDSVQLYVPVMAVPLTLSTFRCPWLCLECSPCDILIYTRLTLTSFNGHFLYEFHAGHSILNDSLTMPTDIHSYISPWISLLPCFPFLGV